MRPPSPPGSPSVSRVDASGCWVWTAPCCSSVPRSTGGIEARLHEDTALARVVWTCSSPSQWNAWTTGGRYLYFRYRHGEGSVEHFPGGPDPDTWDEEGSGLFARWHDGSRRGEIGLTDFLVLAGLRLAPNSEVLDGR